MKDSSIVNTPQLARLERRVAELEAAEKRLQAECEGLRQFYLQAPLAYQSLDSEGCLLEVNQQWLKLLGYAREEVIGKHFIAFLPSDSQEYFQVNFQKFKATGEIFGVEFSLVKGDGTLMDVSFNGKIATSIDGTFQRTHCFFQDITQRKSNEAALRASEERFRALHNASFGGILIHDQGRILDCNQGLAKQTGYSLEELIGREGLDLVTPRSAIWSSSTFNRVLSNPMKPLGSARTAPSIP